MKRTEFKQKMTPTICVLLKKPRSAKCSICYASFTPRNAIKEKWCSVECGAVLGVLLAEKKNKKDKVAAKKVDRINTAKRRLSLKTRAKWLAEAQIAFNAFIRARDVNMPCISSGRPLALDSIGGGYDAGHYRSTGSAPHLRFNEENVHGQSKHDNRYLSGNAVDYRIGLIKRIGLEKVEFLESNQAFKKWTVDDLIGIIYKYKLKLKDLKS